MDWEGGFFSTEEVTSSQPLQRLSGCGACKLYRDCNSPRMEAHGEGRKGILIIAEAPGSKEDKEGVQMIGEAGQYLRRRLRARGIDLDRDCIKINAISCHPGTEKGGTKTPTPFEIECCRPRVWKVIEEVKPHIIILLGTSAVQSFLQHRWKKDLGGIDKWRGWTIPDRDVQAWVCPMVHPSYVLWNEKNPAVETAFNNDLSRALRLLDKPFPQFMSETSCVEIIEDRRQLESILNNIEAFKIPFAFDYEATGLKPHAEGHRIVTMSIAMGENQAIAFDMPGGGRLRQLLRDIMADGRILKMAHGIKFEDNWTNIRLPSPVNGWHWCSMLAAHVLDNRSGITGLKFQTYIRFGLLDYSSHISPYLESSEEEKKKYGGNGFNRIFECPRKDLLIYNGIDSLVEFRLAIKQMEELNYDSPVLADAKFRPGPD